MSDRARLVGRGAVFLGLIALELWLLRSSGEGASLRGFVETEEYRAAPAKTALLRRIGVAIGQPVSAGQVLGEIVPLDSETDDAAAAAPILATSDGVVESIDAHVGDPVGPSAPFATIVAAGARRVVACVPEARIDNVHVGSKAEVHTVSGGHVVHGVVESLTLSVALLPPRCQSAPKVPAYGRTAIVLLDQDLGAAPGQATLVAIEASSSSSSTDVVDTPNAPAGSSASAASTAAAPVPMQVPADLAAVSRFEPSGLIWIAGRDRYLIASDETGLGDAHPPWLFTMDRRGVVDKDPVVVEEVSHLDDLESIAAGDGSFVWLMASQSMSDKGGRPKSRELLVRLVPRGNGYRADAKAHLASMLEEASAETRAKLGVPDVAQLDIEGLAYKDGALYIGLKAPVDDKGRAIIWRSTAPDRLVAKDLAGAQLSIWGRVAMPVEFEGETTPGGVADMMFLDDEHLLLGATASGKSGKRQTGALVVASIAAGSEELRGTELRRFAGLKPEGIAASAEQGKIMVVFDRGKSTPLWVEIDRPTTSSSPASTTTGSEKR
jgi:hypothetical protein